MQNLLYVLILLAAFPAGYLLAWLAKDELQSGRKWFIVLAIVSVLATLPVAFFLKNKLPGILTLFFIAVISLIAVWKSHDKSFLLEKETLERKNDILSYRSGFRQEST